MLTHDTLCTGTHTYLCTMAPAMYKPVGFLYEHRFSVMLAGTKIIHVYVLNYGTENGTIKFIKIALN